MQPVAFGVSRMQNATISRTPVARVSAPSFGNTREIWRDRLENLYQAIEKDIAEGRVTVKKMKGPETAIIDINGKEYEFSAWKDSFFLRHAVKNEVKKVWKLGPFQIWSKIYKQEDGIELGLGEKFFTPGEFTVTYRKFHDDGKQAARDNLAFVRDESNAGIDRAWNFFQTLSRHVFTEDVLKPFLPDKLDY